MWCLLLLSLRLEVALVASLGLLLNTEQNMSAVDCNIPCNILGIRILHTKNKKLGREKRFEVDFSTFSFWASGGNAPPPLKLQFPDMVMYSATM